MWSSTLPTGTVRNEGRSSRTYPQSTVHPDNDPEEPEQTVDRKQRSRAELLADIDRLQRKHETADTEIRRLESQVDRLRSRLADRQQAQQAIVDRYEAIITDLETAATTTPETKHTTSNRGLLSRLKDGLF